MTDAADWRALNFDPGAFAPELFTLCRQVPYLDQLLCQLDDLHDTLLGAYRTLRPHHRELATQGYFDLRLPEAGVTLRSARSLVLEDNAEFFGVQGRPDLILAGSRVGFGQPLCAVVLPKLRAVVTVKGPRWNVDAAAATRAVALFEAAGIDWAAPPDATLAPAIVTGDRNYAHHAWNQLGALATVLRQQPNITVFATHQPLGPLAELFPEYPGLQVSTLPARALPGIDLHRFQPFAAGGKVVLAEVRARVVGLATQRACIATLQFCAEAAARGRKLIWITLRLRDKTPANLADAITGLAEALLQRGFGIVLDGFARPDDFDSNSDYDNAECRRTIAREQAAMQGICAMLRERLGGGAMQHVLPQAGGKLLDSIFLLQHCVAYFAHHGTLQHRAGYFTRLPGLIHANRFILSTDRAATLHDVVPDHGPAEYIAPDLIDDIGPPGGPENLYRFSNIPALVAAFADLLARNGIA